MSTAPKEPAGLDRILPVFDLQIAWCRHGGAPFTADILQVVRNGLVQGGVFNPLIIPWHGNPQADVPQLRIAGALNFLVRTGKAPGLARFYPPHGTASFDANAVGHEIEAAVRANEALVRDILSRPPQTNEVARSATLMPGYAEVARRTGLPLRVLEIGASAGLNMNWDRYAYRYGARFVGSASAPLTISAEWKGPWCGVDALPRVVERRGCDRSPIDLGAPQAADRLISYVWPEQAERLARVEAAIAFARKEKPVIEQDDAAAWLERQLAPPRPGVATVVAHSIVWQYFSKETAEHGRAVLKAAGARATAHAPLAWLSLEQYTVDKMPELRLTMWPGGQQQRLASAHPHGAWIEWLDKPEILPPL